MVNPYARVRALSLSGAKPIAIQALKSCDFLIAATDNHSSRLIANRLSAQYLIPLIHIGVNIDVDEDKNITDMSGEYVLAPLGEWCLQCAGIIDSQAAGWELADEGLRATLRQRGYVQDTPAPAVYHLNGVIASLAVAEIHNFIFPYKTSRRYLTYDELKGELLSLEVQPKEDCLICRSEGGLLGLGDLEPFPDYERREKTIPSADQFGIKEDPKKGNLCFVGAKYGPKILRCTSFAGGGKSCLGRCLKARLSGDWKGWAPYSTDRVNRPAPVLRA